MSDGRRSAAARPAFQAFAARQRRQQHLRVVGIVRGLRVHVSIAHVGVHAGSDAPHRIVDAFDESRKSVHLFIPRLQRRVEDSSRQLLLFQFHFRFGFGAQMMRHHLVIEGGNAAFGHALQLGVEILAEEERKEAVRTEGRRLLALKRFVEDGELRRDEGEAIVEGSPRQ